MNKEEKKRVDKAYNLIHRGFTGERRSLWQEGARLKEITEGLDILRDLSIDG